VLEEALASGRRVLILEEFERTFLKTVGGFAAIWRLLALIPPTASSTLWVISLNDDAMQYLDAATGVGRFFSHRINAMSMYPEDLRNAILQRHNLSGLRLKFAPPPPGDPRLNKVQAWLGIQPDPEALFFEALYAQSSGVFRSAFELWQGSIERVESGVVEMRQPLAPDYARLRSQLDQLDHFTLVAILQHGSLEAQELAEVLAEPAETSWRRLERLESMGILEHDPDHPGIRVLPEARRFVVDVLHRVNLV
jgi:hypothetical protein